MNRDQDMHAQIAHRPGFIAALDQSGGSTPGALRLYGIDEASYHGDAEMFRLVHEMRVRIITAPAFRGDHVIGAILFARTMEDTVQGRPVPEFLWQQRRVVPFLKVDNGLANEADGVRLMKPMPELEALLQRADALGIFGTKMRSVIQQASPSGIQAIVDQQFEVAERIARHGLMPIIEPEVLITIPDKARAEQLLCETVQRKLDALPAGRQVMLKLTIPDVPDLYAPLIAHRAVLRTVALSGGYSRHDACARLARNPGMIASFSRALVDELRVTMTQPEFEAALAQAIDEIYRASTTKE